MARLRGCNSSENNIVREVMGILARHSRFFPHIRKQHVQQAITEQRILTYYDDSRNLLGFIIYRIYKRQGRYGGPGDVELCQIGVKYQRQGVGSFLFTQLENLAIKSSLHRIVLSVREENTTACHFYETMGMEVIGSTSWAEGRIPGLLYVKQLVSISKRLC